MYFSNKRIWRSVKATKSHFVLRFFWSAKDNLKCTLKFKPNHGLQIDFTRHGQTLQYGKCCFETLICFLKLSNWSFDPDFYNFCNFVHKASPHNRSPWSQVKCLPKLHACVHVNKKIEKFLLLKVNVLFIGIKVLAGTSSETQGQI